MSIQPGDTLPDAPLTLIRSDAEPEQTRSGDLFGHGKVLIFAVPGAFTPTCSNVHLPGYVEHMDAFRKRHIAVFCLAVNDAFVMQAWAEQQHVPPDLGMLADGNAAFTRALGLELDGSGYGMGIRARRLALYAEDGVVRQVQAEAPGEFRVSSAEAMLATLG